MNLAEQIKNEMRMKSQIDYDGLTKAMKEIFGKNPNAYVAIRTRESDKIEWGKGINTNYYWMSVPKEWFIDVESWAAKEGFRIERYELKFEVRLF